MDFPSHFIWAYVLFRHYPWAWPAIAFCLVPDFVWAIPLIVLRFNLWRKKLPYSEEEDLQSRYLYRTAHSMITAVLAYFLSGILFGWEMAIGVLAGWTLHLAMDFWTHKGGIVNGIRLFYPLSDFRLPALIWWREEIRKRPWIYLINLAAAAIVYYLTI